jgi:large subunit GTPase 1
MPDTSRAARYVLKDYVSAKLVYCHPPPGIDSDEYMGESRLKMIAKGEEDIRLGKKKAPVTRVAKGADTYVGPAPTVPIESSADDDKQQARERQATAKSIRQNAASAPGRSAAWKSKNLENTFFSEPGPMPRPVAKGAPGLGQEDGYSRTKLYPHAHRLGPDGLPLEMINPPLVPAKNSKKHFKHKEGKKRSGAGYD